LTLVTVITIAASIGTTVPLLLDRIGIDPALATGPFITTSNDLIGLVVYFAIASQIYL
jgi:magnesium transporter